MVLCFFKCVISFSQNVKKHAKDYMVISIHLLIIHMSNRTTKLNNFSYSTLRLKQF
jgi:hypothetical protein